MGSSKSKRWPQIAGIIFLAVVILYLMLLVPDSQYSTPEGGGKKPFEWKQDARWLELESQFKLARSSGCENLNPRILADLGRGQILCDSIDRDSLSPDAPIFLDIENVTFELAPMVGACPEHFTAYESLATKLRQVVKRQSRHWDMNSIEARQRVYRLLYGSREALEEILLQMPGDSVSPLRMGFDEPSATPSAKVLGVTIHSGDILVSRGGAPTSALIARGNDYPGNFSHIALVYVDDKTNLASIIEAHIERGVVISSLEEYLRDKKLRVMVLRLRSDLPELKADPLLPHKAASYAMQTARSRHIPYDFEMNSRNHISEFCSEVASAPYEYFGIHLWMGRSTISSPGLVSWLAVFGVKNFETQEPSDLEYDPQLQVVAEWRDPETLYKDHVDNVVIDAMLEGADKGDRLGYQWYMLPLARILKAYSATLNWFGHIGPIPEGMSATAALRNKQFSQHHEQIKERTLSLAEKFKQENGYSPPYWELFKLARQAKDEIR